MSKITQHNYNVSYAELKGFQKALELVGRAEDVTSSFPSVEVGQHLSKLAVCCDSGLEPIQKDLEKLAKKYEEHTDDKGRFKEGKDNEAEAYNKEARKLWDTKFDLMLPKLPDYEKWEFKVSHRAIALLDILFNDPVKEKK
jgi:hypothetical protein